MNISPINNPSTPSLSSSPPLESPKRVKGHFFSKLSYFPKYMLHLIQKIGTNVINLFKSPSRPSSHFDQKLNITPKFESSLPASLFREQFESDNSIKPPLFIELPQGDEIKTEESDQKEIKNGDSDDESDNKKIYLQSNLINLGAIQPKVIDVPDNGNCLFYALVIGLQKRSFIFFDKESEAQLNILSRAKEILQNPAALLREQAADYLQSNWQDDENVANILLEGIESHNEALQKQLAEQNKTLIFIETDSEISPEEKEGLKKQINEIESFIIQDNEDANARISSYLSMSRQEGFYCGTAQIYALAEIYHLPIEVLFNYDTANQSTSMISRDSLPVDQHLPALKLAHVNGNHFKYAYIAD